MLLGVADDAALSVVRPRVVFQWVSLLARVVLGGAIAYAGLLKIGDLQGSVTAVSAYQLPFPSWMINAIGHALPFVEIVLGVAIIVGLFTRWTAALGGLMMVVYIVAIASVWARGLSIDCGCFSSGGLLLPGESTRYLQDILRDVGLLICAVVIVVFPKSPLAADAWIAGPNPEEA